MSKLNRRQALRFALAACAAPVMADFAPADGHTKTHAVTVKSFKFLPAKLTVKAGDRVVFVKADGVAHTGTADNRSFDTGSLKKGQQAVVTLNKAGKLGYFCGLHPSMKGRITVT